MSAALLITFFFFKQKTAYEVRISDWSSDVCSSDLSFETSCTPCWPRLPRLLEQLAKAEGEVRLRSEELTKARARSSRQLLTAPVDGTVAQLQLHTLGGVVEPTKPVMTSVPEGEALLLDAKVLNKAAGFVHQGQSCVRKGGT